MIDPLGEHTRIPIANRGNTLTQWRPDKSIRPRDLLHVAGDGITRWDARRAKHTRKPKARDNCTATELHEIATSIGIRTQV